MRRPLKAYLRAMNEMVKHAHVHFSGRVQGVGFRYMTRQTAKGFEVGGYVRNLADGRVEMEAEGEKKELEAFIQELQEQLESYIRETDVRWGERPRQYRDFLIAD